MSDNNSPSNAQRLKTLFKEAGIKSTRLDATRRLVQYHGRTRDWTFIANIYNGWFHVSAYVCEIPTAPGLRADLLDTAMVANQKMSLTKFVKSNALWLELEYRDEHIGATDAGNLLGLLFSNAEEYYPRLFRIVTGDAVLASLDDSQALAATGRER